MTTQAVVAGAALTGKAIKAGFTPLGKEKVPKKTKLRSEIEYIPPAGKVSSSSMRRRITSDNDVKIIRMLIKAQKQQNDFAAMAQLLRSPIVQMVGTVLLAELAEEAGILSPSWAGAIEGGVVTMVGLQAIKDYGLIPGGALASAMGIGALSGGGDELPGGYGTWDLLKDFWKGVLGMP